MNQAKPKIRLFVPGHYTAGQNLSLSKNQAHYLTGVMRLRTGDSVGVFNGEDGEWLAEAAHADKKGVLLQLKRRLRAQYSSPDLWLAFAPIKSKTELVVEKATELGVSKIITVIMKHSVVDKVNGEKLAAHAIEAAEQCERCDVPALEECKSLAALLGSWPRDRTLLHGDESGGGAPLKEVLEQLRKNPHPDPLPIREREASLRAGEGVASYGILIGPEGGFSADEQRTLKAAPFVKGFSMGPRILRADTAAVAALSCVQSWLGDWEAKPRFEAGA